MASKYLTEAAGWSCANARESRCVTSGEVFSKVFEWKKNFSTSFSNKKGWTCWKGIPFPRLRGIEGVTSVLVTFTRGKKKEREKKGRRKEKLCKQVCFDFVSFNCEFRTINYIDIVDDKTFTFACGWNNRATIFFFYQISFNEDSDPFFLSLQLLFTKSRMKNRPVRFNWPWHDCAFSLMRKNN